MAKAKGLTAWRDKNFFVSAYAECGVCGTRGPLNGEFTQKRNKELENNVVKKAVNSWNNGVYEKSGEFDN